MVSVKPGQWVTSSAGRDIGAHYLVLACAEERFVLVADGMKRTVAKPKEEYPPLVGSRRDPQGDCGPSGSGGKVTDARIRAALTELVGEKEEVGGPHGQTGRH